MNFSIRATLVLLALAISSAAQNPLAEPLPKPPIGLSGKEVVVVNVTNGLAKSNAEEALEIIEELDVARTEAVIIQIHCLMDTNWEEINLIMGGLGNLKIPSYAFVDSMAVDAGALLSFATDKIYMAPASIIGGSPILGSGNMKAKLASFNLATARSVAMSKGRDPQLVEAIWNEDLEIRLGDEVLSKKGETLMVEAQDAVRVHEGKPFLAEALVVDVHALKEHAGLKGGLRFTNALDPKTISEGSALNALKTKEESYSGNVVVIEVGKRDLINSARFDYMGRVLAKAERENASAIILDLNTPGGLAFQTGEIMMRSLAKMSVPTYAYVNPSAVSAGALIALATDDIYMSPVSAIGAAAVVTSFGELDKDIEKKITSVLVPLCRSVARNNGHDPDYATKFMIPEKEGAGELVEEGKTEDDESLVVEKEEDGTFKLKVKDEDDVGSLLSLAAQEALKPWRDAEPLAKGIATSIEDLIKQEDLKGQVIIAKPLGFELLAQWVTRFSALLLLGAFIAAQFELRMPGFGVFGFTALGLFGLFFFGHYAAGKLIGFEMVALFLLGVGLIIAEFAFFQGTLVAGLLGFVCILASLIYTMADPLVLPTGEISTWKLDVDSLGTSFWNLTLALGGAIGIGLLMARFLPESRLFDRLVLQTASAPTGSGIDHGLGDSSQTDSLVGKTGQTLTPLRPSGTAMIADEARDVVTDGEFVDAQETVKVAVVEGSRIVVRPVSES